HDEASGNRRYLLEAGVEYARHPVDEGGDPYVEHPTRLGNLIEAYENYPLLKYGLDSVFYWYRLWVVLDKDLREEIDNQQSVVDSTVYITFVLYVSACVMVIYAAIGFGTDLHLLYVPRPPALVALAIMCVVAGFVIYRLSLPAHDR